MLKSLKSKISLVYLFLVLTIAVVGVTALLSMYGLRKTINGLMFSNYTSINATAKMLEALEDQNHITFTYTYSKNTTNMDTFAQNTEKFYWWYSVECNHITEVGEKDAVSRLKVKYDIFLSETSRLQEIKKEEGSEAAVKFYEVNVYPSFDSIEEELRSLYAINEMGMFRSKHNVTAAATGSMYIIIFLSAAAVAGGFITARFSVNKTLKPIESLANTIKSVKEGNLSSQAPVFSQDEIGELTIEFNSMTRRLHMLEQSTLGKLMAEKTKSVAIVKSISDPIIVLDNNYTILLLNKACEKLFGIEEEHSIGRHFTEVIKKEDLYDFIYNSGRRIPEKPEQKIIHLNSSDNDYYFNVVVTVVKDTEASMNGVIVLLQNVTQLKQLEKVKSDFISTISHEFKTPLTSIMIGTSLMLDEKLGPLSGKQMQIVETIKEDGEKLSSLVNNLLQLSKLESNQSVFNIRPCSVIGLIDAAVKHFFDQAKSREIHLYYEAEDGLPKVNADTEKISWVLNNLVSNALKYTSPGDEIVITPFMQENKMCISVSDTGVGIPEAYLEKIFDRFVQVESQDSETKGSGLGLAIAKEIIEAHGGEIWCHSKVDLGSIFTFTLPLAR